MEVSQSSGDIQCQFVILSPEDGRIGSLWKGCVAGVEETLQVHLAEFSRDEDADMLIEGQFLGAGQRRAIRGGT